MLLPDEDSSNRNGRLDEVIAEYYQLAEQGQAPDARLFVARHPDLADELTAFLADKAAFDRHVSFPFPVSRPEQPTRPPLPSLSDADTTVGRDDTAVGPKAARPSRFGDYELIAEIARGGMGVVWRARQVSLDRPVALKMILSGPFASETDVVRFCAEAAAAGNLDHPNILPIYEAGAHDGQHYFSMKLIAGQSLAGAIPDLLQDPRSAVRLLVQVARAVHHAHARGILHRDLKPANILLDEQGSPYVTDFGLAKKLDSAGLTRTGAIMGTPSYIAPEQARAEKGLTTAADIYSLGAILYECLTGRPPFRGANPLDTLLEVLEKEPVSPRTLDPAISRDLETIVLKCLAKDAANRYSSASALADDLERYLRGEPILARPRSTWEQAMMWARRRPAIAGLTAALALVVLAGLTGVFWQWRQAEAARGRETKRANQAQTALKEAEQARASEEQRAKAEKRAREDERLALEDAERSLYLQQIALARQAWQAGNMPLMRDLLDRCPPRRRAWEWGYLRRLGHTELRTLSVGSIAEQVAFSPDDSRLAVIAGEGREVRFLDPATGKEVHRFSVAKGYIRRIAFAPDGNRLAVGITMPGKPRGLVGLILGKLQERGPEVPPGVVEFRDPRTGKLVGPALEGPASRALAFSPDGKRLAVGGRDRIVRVYEAGKLQRTLKGHLLDLRGVAFHPNGRHLASLTLRDFKVWDVETGREAFSPEAVGVGGSWLAWSPDGRRLAVADSGNLVKVLDPSNGRLLQAMPGHGDTITCVAFHPDGRTLASAGQDRTVRLWDPIEGTPVSIVRGHDGEVRSVAFSRDGRMLASCAWADDGKTHRGEVKLHDATREDQEALPLRGQGAVRSAGTKRSETLTWLTLAASPASFFHPDGERFTAATVPGELKTWNVHTGEELASHDLGALLAARQFSPDNRWLATTAFAYTNEEMALLAEKQGILGMALLVPKMMREGNLYRVRLYEAETGKPGRALESPAVNPLGLAFSRDGKHLAVCAGRGAKVWDVATSRKLWTISGHPALTTRVALSPDGRWLATGSDSALNWAIQPGTKQSTVIKLWDLTTGKERWELKPNTPLGSPLVMSPDSAWLVTPGNDGTTLIHDLRAGKLKHTLPRQRSRPTLAAFSLDSRLLAIAGADGVVHLHEVKTAKWRYSLRGHTRALAAIAFSRDGSRMVSSASVLSGLAKRGLQPGEMKVWDLASGREVLSLDGQGEVQFSPDGGRLASAGPAYGMRLWDATALTEEEGKRRRQAWAGARRRHHERLAEESKTAGNTGSLIFHLGELIRLAPADPTFRVRRGDAYANRGEFDRAVTDFTEALKLAPVKESAWSGKRGLALVSLGRYDKAIADLTEALGGKEPTTDLLLGRGRAHLGAGQFDKAAADFTAVLRKEAKNRAALAGRGEVNAAREKWQEADEDLAQAITLDPGEADVWSHRLLVLLASGRQDDYRATLAKMRVRFNQEAAYPGLVLHGVLVPGAIDGVTLLKLAMRGARSEESGRGLVIGSALVRAGLVESGLRELLAAEKRGEASPLTAFFVALASHKLGKKAEARSAFDRSVRMTEEGERKKTLTWQQRIIARALRQEIAKLLE
jgi:WD40 repeat protein